MGTCSSKFHEARAIAYVDDGYIKAKLRKEDAGLELNVSQDFRPPQGRHPTGCLGCGAEHHRRNPRVDSPQVVFASFCREAFVGIGVPIGTDAFVQNLIAKTCRAIITL